MQPRHARRRRGPGRAPSVVLACLLVAGAVAVVPKTVDSAPRVVGPAPRVVGPAPRVVEPVETPAGPTVRAGAVLRGWDRARAAAWSRGAVGALRRLYVDGAGASDVRLLEAYVERGLRVRGLRMQVLALEVLVRRPGEWRLRVTDRLARGRAVTAGWARTLPRDRATTRTLRLVRVGGAWRMAAVR